MDFKKLKFDAADIVKGFILMGTIVSMWVDLKTDQVRATEQRQFLQYQIDELKLRCEATKPDPPAIKTYKIQ